MKNDVLNISLSLKNVYYSYDDQQVLRNINLDIQKGEFVSLIGPSGSGKSTLLNIISGLQSPDSGKITIDGQEKSCLGRTSHMHQQDTLLPWRNALENAILGLEINGFSKDESKKIATKLFREFGLFDSIYKMPWQMSGGMKQRIAFLRNMLISNEILLLDEPFGSVDAITRTSLRKWLKNILVDYPRTVLLVTHDIDEAILLSNRIFVLSNKDFGIISEINTSNIIEKDGEIIFSEHYLLLRRQILELLKLGKGSN